MGEIVVESSTVNIETELISQRRYFEIGCQIENLLHSGEFNKGERLPSERELSERFSTSRATIREAIIMLELKGLVSVKKGAGIFFSMHNQQPNAPLSDFTSGVVGPFELLQARQVIESNIAAFAATNIKLSELKEIKKVLKRQQALVEVGGDELEELDERFHTLIAESTQNRVLINQAKKMWSSVRTKNPMWQKLNQKYLHEETLRYKWLAEHKDIFSALQRRSPELARKAVLAHIGSSRNELVKIATAEGVGVETEDWLFT